HVWCSEIVALVFSVTSAMAPFPFLSSGEQRVSYRNRNGGGATPPSSPSLMAFQLFPSSSLRNAPALVPAYSEPLDDSTSTCTAMLVKPLFSGTHCRPLSVDLKIPLPVATHRPRLLNTIPRMESFGNARLIGRHVVPPSLLRKPPPSNVPAEIPPSGSMVRTRMKFSIIPS